MKVEQTNYKPITITLETYEEARQMYYHLNVPSGQVEDVWRKSQHAGECFDCDYTLRTEFNKVFSPCEIE